MELSVELSFYPLQDQYKKPILALIDALKQESSIEVISNRMSTQLFGEYDSVMMVLNRLMKASFEQYGSAVFVAKFINSDRRPKA
ncbi:hypothetical protein [Alkalimarinus sediminis]|uniref:Thiamin/hydroxymethyl pyrimidine-binding YkoF putative domain-containing protein n=1 Tax=Alkalimarinus sediminis TaxID=1632866 RepID=A0A9E8HRJ2_9ALTE|nr:hypothetical protein [Alkalimarinus sediminis]UZW75161.1 hypothetical protein NNL22_00715 [Alkalimarinus sediminis]